MDSNAVPDHQQRPKATHQRHQRVNVEKLVQEKVDALSRDITLTAFKNFCEHEDLDQFCAEFGRTHPDASNEEFYDELKAKLDKYKSPDAVKRFASARIDAYEEVLGPLEPIIEEGFIRMEDFNEDHSALLGSDNIAFFKKLIELRRGLREKAGLPDDGLYFEPLKPRPIKTEMDDAFIPVITAPTTPSSSGAPQKPSKLLQNLGRLLGDATVAVNVYKSLMGDKAEDVDASVFSGEYAIPHNPDHIPLFSVRPSEPADAEPSVSAPESADKQ